jgi:hypothetical protein
MQLGIICPPGVTTVIKKGIQNSIAQYPKPESYAMVAMNKAIAPLSVPAELLLKNPEKM